METKQLDSVMAKLMGLDELPPKLPSNRNCRLLSDDYIRKVSSICIREGSSVRQKYSTNLGMFHGGYAVSGVQKSSKEQAVTSKKNVGVRSQELAGISLFKSLNEANFKKEKPYGKEVEDCSHSNVLRFPQKLDHDSNIAGVFGADDTKFSFHLHRSDRGSRFLTSIKRIKSEKLINGFRDEKMDIFPTLGNRKHRDNDGIAAISVLRQDCIICNRILYRVSQQERCIRELKEVPGSKYNNDSHNDVTALIHSSRGECDDKNHNCVPNNFLDESSLDGEVNEENLERWTTAKTVGETVTSTDKESTPRNLNLRLERNESDLKLDESTAIDDLSKKQNISGKDFIEARDGESSEQFQSLPHVQSSISGSTRFFEAAGGCFPCFDLEKNAESSTQKLPDIVDDSHVSDEGREVDIGLKVSKSTVSNIAFQCTAYKTLTNDACSGISENELFEPDPGNLAVEDGRAAFVAEVLNEEASLDVFSEQDVYPNHSWMCCPGLLDDLNGNCQRSPDSVLEPFDSRHSTLKTSESLQLLLQSLNSEPEETYSEGSVVVVSGDEDSEDEICNSSRDGLRVEAWFEDDESRDFSYLVDVLDESGFCGVECFTDFNAWHSLEYPISPSVFESLEKKYGKQTSWQKSERHLLFDRINSGLSDILIPIRNFHTYTTTVRRRFSSAWRRDKVEDEIWMVLISQEKEKCRRELSEQVMSGADKWLEVDEDLCIICGELETSLLDDLVIECASLLD